MTKPLLLDLFCGSGGAAMGYSQSGFEIIGIDVNPQKHYPFPFIQGDWRTGLDRLIDQVDAIHASPPCQGYSKTLAIHPVSKHSPPMLISQVRQELQASGKPWVIENVSTDKTGLDGIMLCGVSFGLKVFRHRRFESNLLLLSPGHTPHGMRRIGIDGYCCPAGHGDSGNGRIDAYHRRASTWRKAMGINWYMNRHETAQAIPPAYTHFIGDQLIRAIGA